MLCDVRMAGLVKLRRGIGVVGRRRLWPVGSLDTEGKAGFFCGNHEHLEGAARKLL